MVRNRIKRSCREFFRLHRHRITASWDILLIAKKQAATSDNKAIRQSLAHLFRYLTG